MITTRAKAIGSLALFLFSFFEIVCSQATGADTCTSGDCQKGDFFNISSSTCHPCPDGSYMETSNHNCTTCKPCTRVERYPMAVILSPCSLVSDASIGCKTGYFMSADERDLDTLCVQCSICPIGQMVKQKCSDISDTVCAPATPYPTALTDDHVFDTGILIACMVLLAMIVVGIIIYVVRTPQFRRNVSQCFSDRCSSRDDNIHEREMLFLN